MAPYAADISPGNVAMAAQDYAFCEEGLQEAFGDDVKSYLEVFQETREQNLPPRPPNLPEYIVIPWGELCTDVFDMSQVDFLDFGSGMCAINSCMSYPRHTLTHLQHTILPRRKV